MCSMPVSSEVFGDPCPNTQKYVEVHFACSPKVKKTTTKRPLPPWFLQVNIFDDEFRFQSNEVLYLMIREELFIL